MPLFAAAGPNDGGGGGGFICRTENGKIKPHGVELLDLWEGRNNELPWGSQVKKLNIPYTNEPVDLQINRAMQKLFKIDPALYEKVVNDLNYIKTHRDPLSPNKIIYPPVDALNTYGKPGCPLGGMMYFDGYTKKLVVDEPIFQELQDNTNIAASLTHEAIYKAYRDLNVIALQDSTPARRLNACLYSTDDCVGFKENALTLPRHQMVLKCHGDMVDYYVYQIGNLEFNTRLTTKFLFTRIGRFSYTKVPLTKMRTIILDSDGHAYGRDPFVGEWVNPLLGAFYRPLIDRGLGSIGKEQAYVDILLGKTAPIAKVTLSYLQITASGEILENIEASCQPAN